LKNTYVDALPQLIHPATGRVHASFNQSVAATGRLSSSDPNLQNIPIRTREGREIRSAFLPGEEGWRLVAADYSQIELRVLAHLSGDATMRAAFDRDEDIHARVASQVYGVGLNAVTSEMRRVAKAVNFGVIYGQSPFGLSKMLDIDQQEATEFIRAYFAGYPGISRYLETILADCCRDGYVSTILGRRRSIRGVRPPNAAAVAAPDESELADVPEPEGLPDAEFSAAETRMEWEPNASVPPLHGNAGLAIPQRNLAERTAINTVIQGSAADIIKLAMINIHRRLRSEKWASRMLLQIHDELVFESPPEELDRLVKMVREEMSGVMQLSVPLKVDAKTGSNWADCEPWRD
jgi:DNA polymerase-1